MADREYTDAERLDWMGAAGAETRTWPLPDGRAHWGLYEFPHKELGRGPTLRAAIDAAMRRAEGEGKP